MRIKYIDLVEVGVFTKEKIFFPEKPKCSDGAEIHIFTGPNGCGKSTLLMAMKYAFGNSEDYLLEQSTIHRNNVVVHFPSFKFFKLSKRFRSDKSNFTVAWENTTANQYYNQVLKSADKLYIQSNDKGINYLDLPVTTFYYEGNRKIELEEVNLINPSNSITNWLANKIATAAIAKSKNDSEYADLVYKEVHTLEKVISDITSSEITFDLTDRPMTLRVIQNGLSLDIDSLPDGIISLLSWLGDLLRKLDLIPVNQRKKPFFEQSFVLFLDELENHLHPAWQRKVLPAIKILFPSSQVFVSTHSPFVVNSVDDAWVYEFQLENRTTTVPKPTISDTSKTFDYVIRQVFDIETEFGPETEELFSEFYELKKQIIATNGNDPQLATELIRKRNILLKKNQLNINNIVGFEIRQLDRLFPNLELNTLQQ